ncbi:LysR family transcriptional regulator [Paracoccus sp. MC1854]|uniref:LysR substrate-binding domain-containing protein n=1 Tax=Paracoccus sp. MC1854 TaxID=2760306 RepID=UPI0015FFF07B|nr:LysR substrate-binding domain-containing protein [Paracoccus sp. MC1854]MBB1492948.1 LysR family transcriptional regulator [Paracoccus sp. MC1854]
MIRDLNLNALVYFETVARLGRVTKAAEELGVSASAVSQQIRLLEQQFGVRLFRRHKQRLSLTLDGDRLYQTTTEAFRSIRDVHTAIVRQRESHHLNLRVSPSFGVRWLGPRLASFAAANPQWDLRIDATPDFTDFDTEVVDVDLRYGAGDWSGLHTECMVRDLVLPMCSPDYLAGLHRLSDDPHEQLRAARLIDSVKTLIRWDAWLPRNDIVDVKRVYAYRFDRSSMAIQFAKDGGGVVLDSATLAGNELKEGSMIPLSPAFEVIDIPAYWLVCPSRHLSRRIVRIFSDWLRVVGREHNDEARDLLLRAGCRIRDEDEPAPLAIGGEDAGGGVSLS